MEVEEEELQDRNCESDNDSLEECNTNWYNCNELDSGDEKLIESCSKRTFCFETDHAALKGNTDYHNLLKALTMLQVQRIKAIEDIEKLEKLLCKVKINPREYLKKVLNGDNFDIPSRIEVQQVPEIDWTKYMREVTEAQPFTTVPSNQPLSSTLEKPTIQKEIKGDNCIDIITNSMTVRGRAFDQSKPQTFNQLWTPEEQLRLEELLLEFPPERNENSRWRKIAQALGNRTAKQVCSRVQKYFKKLSKAGLPIPGHQLKTNNMIKNKLRRSKKRNTWDSTFFPTQHLGAMQHLDGCEEDEVKTKPHVLTAELKLDIVKRVIEFKRKDAELAPFSHLGIKCTVCAEMPLQGTRWHCLVCQSVNLCSDCVISQLSKDHTIHPPSHPLEPLSHPEVAHWDPDYMPDSFQSTNYLDPNFVMSNVI